MSRMIYESDICDISCRRNSAAGLAASGTRIAFTVPGESFLSLLDAFLGAGIRPVATRHEGAAAFMALLASPEAAERNGWKPRARVVATVNMGDCPTLMLNAPVPAARTVLAKAGLATDDIDVWEINEAFAVVAEKFQRDLALDRAKVNINGGSIALGHPIGATGSMLIGTALDELERTGGRYGLITMCAAGGMAPAIIIERL